MTKPDTEFSRWQQLPDRQKSFAVELLHFFHYVPQRVRRCWTREELLTWELYRALQILPRGLALRPFMSLCAEAGRDAAAAASQLLRDLDTVRLLPYPRLNLSGNQRNCKSDLGLYLGDRPRLWIEAKTALGPAATLAKQLQFQRRRLRALANDAAAEVIALVPDGQDVGAEPSVRWSQVVTLLQDMGRALAAHPARDLTPGLAVVARELVERIRGHESRLVVA